jgi:hypothetical protein
MHWHIGIDVEAQLHFRSIDPEHRDLEQATKTIGSADYHGFLAFP